MATKIMKRSKCETFWFTVFMGLFLSIILGIIFMGITSNDKAYEYKGFEIVSENIHENIVEIVMLHDGVEYMVQYYRDDLEDLVCHKGVYEYADVQREYDCSTPEKIEKAMLEELREQSIESMLDDEDY